MATIRKRFKVAWAGQPPVEVQTNAKDMTRAADHDNTMTSMFALLHASLVRQNFPGVPRKFDDFLDLLDEVTPIELDEDEVEGPDPTHEAAMPGELSSSVV